MRSSNMSRVWVEFTLPSSGTSQSLRESKAGKATTPVAAAVVDTAGLPFGRGGPSILKIASMVLGPSFLLSTNICCKSRTSQSGNMEHNRGNISLSGTLVGLLPLDGVPLLPRRLPDHCNQFCLALSAVGYRLGVKFIWRYVFLSVF